MHAAEAPQPSAASSSAAPSSAATPSPRLVTFADRLARTLSVARALILSGRTVDLAGIEDGIGLLCAKTLDLAPDEARAMLPTLLAMRGEVESLTAVLHAGRPG